MTLDFYMAKLIVICN